MRLKNFIMLLCTAAIWGSAFTAQSIGNEIIGPFTFLCARNFIAAIALLPVILLFGRSKASIKEEKADEKKRSNMLILGGIFCGTALFFGGTLQQIGILYTSVGKAGFLTTCYILIVPIVSLFFGKKCGKFVWIGIAFALVGLYFLCVTEGFSFAFGDILVFIGAFGYAAHILIIDHFSPYVDSVKMSFLQFVFCAILSAVGMFLFETPQIASILSAWKPLLFTGVLSSGVAYTLQIIGQKGMNPTICSLIMSLESVISVIVAWLVLNQAMTLRELLGCLLMFIAIILAQIPKKNKSAV